MSESNISVLGKPIKKPNGIFYNTTLAKFGVATSGDDTNTIEANECTGSGTNKQSTTYKNISRSQKWHKTDLVRICWRAATTKEENDVMWRWKGNQMFFCVSYNAYSDRFQMEQLGFETKRPSCRYSCWFSPRIIPRYQHLKSYTISQECPKSQ